MKVLNEVELEAAPYEVGVHVTHCCGKHGCKYGDSDCSVKSGEYAQKYACPSCKGADYLATEQATLQSELAWTEELATRGIIVPRDSDGYDY